MALMDSANIDIQYSHPRDNTTASWVPAELIASSTLVDYYHFVEEALNEENLNLRLSILEAQMTLTKRAIPRSSNANSRRGKKSKAK